MTTGKTILASLLSLCALTAMAQVNVLERFDTEKTFGTLLEGAKTVPDAGLEKGALEAAGNTKGNQVFYQLWFDCKPGDQFALAFDYRTSLPYANQGCMSEIVFTPVK